MAIRYLVTLEYSDYLDSHSIFKFDGKIKIIAVTYYQLSYHRAPQQFPPMNVKMLDSDWVKLRMQKWVTITEFNLSEKRHQISPTISFYVFSMFMPILFLFSRTFLLENKTFFPTFFYILNVSSPIVENLSHSFLADFNNSA